MCLIDSTCNIDYMRVIRDNSVNINSNITFPTDLCVFFFFDLKMAESNSNKRACESDDDVSDCKEACIACEKCVFEHDEFPDCSMCGKSITDCYFWAHQLEFGGDISFLCCDCYYKSSDLPHKKVNHVNCIDQQVPPHCRGCNERVTTHEFFRMPTGVDETPKFFCMPCGNTYNAENQGCCLGKALYAVTLDSALSDE